MFKRITAKILLVLLVTFSLIGNNPTPDSNSELGFSLFEIAQANTGDYYCQGATGDNAEECVKNGGWWIKYGMEGLCAGGTGSTPQECIKNGGQWVNQDQQGMCAGATASTAEMCVVNGGQWVYSWKEGYCQNATADDAGMCVVNGGQWISRPTVPDPPPPAPDPVTIDRNINVVIDTGGLSTDTTSGKNSNSQDNTGTGLGEVVTHTTKKPFNIYFSNNPTSSTITMENEKSVEIVISEDDTLLTLPVKSDRNGSYGNSLNIAKNKYDKLINSMTIYLYDLNKVSVIPDNLLNLTMSREGRLKEFTPTTKQSLTDSEWLKVDNGGYYAVIIEVSSKTQTPSVTRIATTFKADKLGEFTALPIKNKLNAFTENRNLMEGKINNPHNLNFTFSGFDSMKVCSIYDANTNQYLIGSANGGLKLFNSNMESVDLLNQTLADNFKVSQIVEVSNSKFLVSTFNDGVYSVDSKSKEISKMGSVKDSKNNSMLVNDIVIISTDNDLKVYKFQDKTGELSVRTSLTTKEIFGSDVKLGEVSLVGGKILVSPLYNQGNNKVAIVSL